MVLRPSSESKTSGAGDNMTSQALSLVRTSGLTLGDSTWYLTCSRLLEVVVEVVVEVVEVAPLHRCLACDETAV